MTPGALEMLYQKAAYARLIGLTAVKIAPNELEALIALARRALELESALNYLHKESPMSTSDFEPHAILMLAKQLGWTPTAKGEHG